MTHPHVIAVADGMGGHAGGEIASAIALEILARRATIFTGAEMDKDSADDYFNSTIDEIDNALKVASDDDPTLSGLGTTLTTLFIRDNQAVLLHVGDSRAYRIRGASIEQLSVDHTVMQELLSAGTIIQADIAEHPQRSMLTQALMGSQTLSIGLHLFDVKGGDRFILCSDGLSGVLTDKEIKTLVKSQSPKDAVTALVDATYINGAPDNVTIIVADITDGPPAHTAIEFFWNGRLVMSKLLGERYLLGAMIGTGGMADVYTAQDQRLSREVAVKILRSDLAQDPSFVSRFRKEAKAAAGLNHPGIVAVYDSGENPAPYIVMELVTGHTLRELIHEGERIECDRALEIITGVLEALDFSHMRGIVHRDIKPANIMITESGDVKVMDFGIARAIDDLGATLTSTWNIVGTAQYLSPEQAQGSIADSRSDLYSTGCLLYELLTGRPPFTGETPVSIALQHVSGQYTPARSLQPDLPADIETVLAVALSKSPDARYQDALSMLADIKRLRSGVHVTTKIARIRPLKRRSFLIAGGSVLIASVLAIVGLSINGVSEPSVGFELANVVGLTEDQARELLNQYVVTVNRAHDPRIPSGRIASQIPLASSDVKPGSGVVLTISDGPGNAIVPDGLIGMALTDARAALATAGLVVSQTIATPSDEAQGTVLEVLPGAGSTITAGSGVILTIASGEVEVPDLVGIEVIQAKTLLFNSDFLIKEFYDYDPTQPIGVVIRQAPEAGTTQTIGDSVTITINRAP